MSANATDDPRDPAEETKLTFPDSWQAESSDGLSASVMFISGLIMVTRNRYIAWPSLLLSINSIINQHPLRTKEGGNNPFSTLLLGVCALLASYMPLVMLSPQRGPAQSPLPVQ